MSKQTDGLFTDVFPVSFTYGGKPFQEEFTKKPDENKNKIIFIHPDGLEFYLQAEKYADTGAIEWTGWFNNTGENNSLQIKNINALNFIINCPLGKSIIASSRGAGSRINDFEYAKQTVMPGQSLRFDTMGSTQYLPFFSLENAGSSGGIIIGLGWTGRWFFNIAQRDTEATLTAGMPDADFYLRPGEQVRTPRILLLPWEGANIGGHNLLRRHMTAHHLPKGNDGFPQPQSCLMTWGGMKSSNHFKLLNYIKANNLKYNCYWMDAGWNGEDKDKYEYLNFRNFDWAYPIGDWSVNQFIHPGGLKPLTDAIHANNMKFLLWCGAFACHEDAGWYLEHPEFGRIVGQTGPFIEDPKTVKFALIYLDDAKAVEFLIDNISRVISENGVDYYREDTQFPSGHLDEENRAGIGEMKAIEGFYKYWDGLRERNPGLIIDNCGGGGTRLDLETLSRSYCFWRSDFNCHPDSDPIGCQNATFGVNHWSPFISGAILDMKNDTYRFRSGLCACMVFPLFRTAGDGFGETEPAIDFNVEWHKKMLEQFDQVKHYLWGDYYPLTEFDAGTGAFMAYQMERPDLQSGFILAFRRQDCESGILIITPVLEQGAQYEFINIDTGDKIIFTGGGEYKFIFNNKPESALILYFKK